MKRFKNILVVADGDGGQTRSLLYAAIDLARRNDADLFVTDRFEFFVGGREIANGFSELNDAEDQAERFRLQVEEKEAGDHEAMHYSVEPSPGRQVDDLPPAH